MTDVQPAISVRDVVVSYDGRRVLERVSLDVQHGETMVLLGGSGSGKSTLLRQIIGLERPESHKWCRSGGLQATGIEENPAFHWRCVSELGALQFDVRRR